MKDFLKWLGVNEKVAKVAIWLFIMTVCMIVINTALDSMGLPYYKITVDNLRKINTYKVLEYTTAYFTSLMNFYAVIFLVFRVKEFKKVFPYSILYLLLNALVNVTFGYSVSQIFIILYIIVFCYLFSNKNSKYIVYAIISYITNIVIQYIWYLYKIRYINFQEINNATQTILSLDLIIIMIIVILAKEIYLKRRGENKCQHASYGGDNSKKKAALPKK